MKYANKKSLAALVAAIVLMIAMSSTRIKAQTAALGTLVVANISNLGAGIGTWLVTPSGANLASALTSALTAGGGGTGSTTVPSAGQLPVGNSGGTAYAPQTLTGDCTITSGGALTCTQVNGSNFTVNSSGLLTKADGITLAGFSFAGVIAQTSLSNSSATSQVTLATSPAAGDYFITYNLDLHTACTTGTGALNLAFGWTANAARALTTGNWPLTSTQGASVPFSGLLPIHVVSGNVTFTPTLATACATGTATWDGSIALLRTN